MATIGPWKSFATHVSVVEVDDTAPVVSDEKYEDAKLVPECKILLCRAGRDLKVADTAAAKPVKRADGRAENVRKEAQPDVLIQLEFARLTFGSPSNNVRRASPST
jgi:hypothetical protein